MKTIFMLLLFLMPSALLSGLGFESNHNKQVMLLRSFDIDPNYLHDEKLNDVIHAKKEPREYKRYYNAMQRARLYIPTIKNILTILK